MPSADSMAVVVMTIFRFASALAKC